MTSRPKEALSIAGPAGYEIGQLITVDGNQVFEVTDVRPDATYQLVLSPQPSRALRRKAAHDARRKRK